MSPSELNLLLTVARIMRARITDSACVAMKHNREDYQALQRALAPFDWVAIEGQRRVDFSLEPGQPTANGGVDHGFTSDG
jgi:hypothetical protein